MLVMADGTRVVVVAEQLRRLVPGGIGTYSAGLLKGLAELVAESGAGFDVTVAASPWAGSGPDPLAAHGFPVAQLGGPLVAGVAVVGRAAGWLGSALAAASQAASSQILSRLWDRGFARLGIEADLVHGTSLAMPPAGRAPVTVMIHDVAWREMPEAYPYRGVLWHEAALRRVSRTASGVLVPSQAAASALRSAAVELDPAIIEVIPEGCDHLPPPDRPAAKRLLESLGVTGEYLLSVSTLEPRKNLRRLIEAYGMIRRDLPEPWPLVVVGPAGWGPELPAGEGVVLAGLVGGAVLSALYAGARVMAYVPVAEGFGLPAVEAMAAGAPLLASSGVPSVTELDPAPARVVNPLDAGEIAAGLADLATDDLARDRLRILGQAAVAGRTWAAVAQQHVAWWARVSGSSRGR